MTDTPNKGGRPTDHNEEIAQVILGRIAEGESVRVICLDDDMPNASTIHRWVLMDTEGFSKKYEEAKMIGAEIESDLMDEIAETEQDVARAKLRIDTKKWNLSKKLPKRFGDRSFTDHTTNGESLNIVFDTSFKDKD